MITYFRQSEPTNQTNHPAGPPATATLARCHSCPLLGRARGGWGSQCALATWLALDTWQVLPTSHMHMSDVLYFQVLLRVVSIFETIFAPFNDTE